jgi:hypothetical protein
MIMLLAMYIFPDSDEAFGGNDNKDWACNARCKLREEGLADITTDMGWFITEKGKVLVEAMMRTPMPVKITRWEIGGQQ